MKATIVVLLDPKSGSEDALGRVFNALAAAYDFKQGGDDVTILFHGAGTRWIGELTKAEHPAHTLFEEVKDEVAGASCGCLASTRDLSPRSCCPSLSIYRKQRSTTGSSTRLRASQG